MCEYSLQLAGDVLCYDGRNYVVRHMLEFVSAASSWANDSLTHVIPGVVREHVETKGQQPRCTAVHAVIRQDHV
jgi:hypothetical protein